jgi:hypothetical protein
MLSLDLVCSDKGLPFLNSAINFLDSSECLNPKDDLALGLIFKRGLYKSMNNCSLNSISDLDCESLLPKISKMAREKLS